MTSKPLEQHLVKLGGSLLDWPDWPDAFERWRDGRSLLLLIGGGQAADMVRAHCARHQLDEALGHDLAMQAMRLNMHLVAPLLPDAQIVSTWDELAQCKGQGLALLDAPVLFEQEPIPRNWQFTSDSLAAHAAKRIGADQLTLLKSTLNANDLVDSSFAMTARSISRVSLVNLRDANFPAVDWPIA